MMKSPRLSSEIRVERPGLTHPRLQPEGADSAGHITRLLKGEEQGLPIQLARLCTALGYPPQRSANHILDIIDLYIYSISLDCNKVSVLIKISALAHFSNREKSCSLAKRPLILCCVDIPWGWQHPRWKPLLLGKAVLVWAEAERKSGLPTPLKWGCSDGRRAWGSQQAGSTRLQINRTKYNLRGNGQRAGLVITEEDKDHRGRMEAGCGLLSLFLLPGIPPPLPPESPGCQALGWVLCAKGLIFLFTVFEGRASISSGRWADR